MRSKVSPSAPSSTLGLRQGGTGLRLGLESSGLSLSTDALHEQSAFQAPGSLLAKAWGQQRLLACLPQRERRHLCFTARG